MSFNDIATCWTHINSCLICWFHLQLKKMSCDLLEHAKQGYKIENGTVPPEPQIIHETVVQPKTIQSSSLDQVFQTYTNVSF